MPRTCASAVNWRGKHSGATLPRRYASKALRFQGATLPRRYASKALRFQGATLPRRYASKALRFQGATLPRRYASKALRSFFHKLRSCTIENFNEQFNEQFKSLFDAHRPVPTKGPARTQNWALGAVLTYQLLLCHRWKHKLPLRKGLKYALRAA